MKPLRHPDGRFRSPGPIAAMPTYEWTQGGARMPMTREMEAIGLRRRDLPEYARTHHDERAYRDLIAGMRDGATEGEGPLL